MLSIHPCCISRATRAFREDPAGNFLQGNFSATLQLAKLAQSTAKNTARSRERQLEFTQATLASPQLQQRDEKGVKHIYSTKLTREVEMRDSVSLLRHERPTCKCDLQRRPFLQLPFSVHDARTFIKCNCEDPFEAVT